MHDYQLHPGDRITMRVLDSRTRRSIPVRFTYVGITKEFPTAPKDAYTIVNAGYVSPNGHPRPRRVDAARPDACGSLTDIGRSGSASAPGADARSVSDIETATAR